MPTDLSLKNTFVLGLQVIEDITQLPQQFLYYDAVYEEIN
jgi:hypothetical protein